MMVLHHRVVGVGEVLGGVRCPNMFMIGEVGVGQPQGTDMGMGIHLLMTE